MTIFNRLKSGRAWLGPLCLGCALFTFACAHDEDAANDSSQHHGHHSGGGGRYGQDKDKAEYPISRILTVRRPQCRDSSYKVSARFCSATWLGQIRFSGKSGGRKERWAIRPKADAQSGR